MNKNNNLLISELDNETMKLLEENDKIVGKLEEMSPKMILTSEEREAKVEKIFSKIQEVTQRSMSSVALAEQVYEAGEGEEKVEMIEAVSAVTPSNTTEPAKKDCLKTFRKEQGWNQQEAAQKLGVSQGLISQVESGRIPMSKKLRAKMDSFSKSA